MTDTERLLLTACKDAIIHKLEKNGLGEYDYTDTAGFHYIFDGKRYLVTVHEEGEKKDA